MASSQQFMAPKQPVQQPNIALIREKLKELGPGPYTPEQQKQRELLHNMLGSQFSSTNQAQESSQTGYVNQNQILDKRALQDLVKEVDPTEQLDEDVEDMLLQVADDFIENIINTSCQLAKHRKSNILEAKDVQFHIERNFNIWIPGFSTDELKPFKKSYATEAHKQVVAVLFSLLQLRSILLAKIIKQRLQLIKKSSKPADGKESKNNKD